MKYTNFLIIDLKNKRTATKAMNVMKNRLSNGFACDDHYEDSPSGRMMNDLQILNGTMILLPEGNGYYLPKDAEVVITELMKYLAENIGGKAFEWFSHSSSTNDFAKADALYEDGILRIVTEFWPDCHKNPEWDKDFEKLIDRKETLLKIA